LSSPASLRHAELAVTYLTAWTDPARRDAATEALGELGRAVGLRRLSARIANAGGWSRAETTGPARTLPARMCGRYTYTTRRSDAVHARLADTLGIETPPSDRGFERFNIAPTQEVLAVVDNREGRRVEELRWGLVPHLGQRPQRSLLDDQRARRDPAW
jgi:SOS response associated peptidase (SRAP)